MIVHATYIKQDPGLDESKLKILNPLKLLLKQEFPFIKKVELILPLNFEDALISKGNELLESFSYDMLGKNFKLQTSTRIA